MRAVPVRELPEAPPGLSLKFMVPKVSGLMGVPHRPNTRSSLRLIPGFLMLDSPRGLLWIVTTLDKFGAAQPEQATVLRFS